VRMASVVLAIWLRKDVTRSLFNHQSKEEAMTKPSGHDAASLPQPREICPTCGSNKRDLRVRQECKYMCPPVNWKWVRDEYGRCTDFIECCNPWHELVAASLPVDRGAPQTCGVSHSMPQIYQPCCLAKGHTTNHLFIPIEVEREPWPNLPAKENEE
jgi:hypothetical protein